MLNAASHAVGLSFGLAFLDVTFLDRRKNNMHFSVSIAKHTPDCIKYKCHRKLLKYNP